MSSSRAAISTGVPCIASILFSSASSRSSWSRRAASSGGVRWMLSSLRSIAWTRSKVCTSAGCCRSTRLEPALQRLQRGDHAAVVGRCGALLDQALQFGERAVDGLVAAQIARAAVAQRGDFLRDGIEPVAEGMKLPGHRRETGRRRERRAARPWHPAPAGLRSADRAAHGPCPARRRRSARHRRADGQPVLVQREEARTGGAVTCRTSPSIARRAPRSAARDAGLQRRREPGATGATGATGAATAR